MSTIESKKNHLYPEKLSEYFYIDNDVPSHWESNSKTMKRVLLGIPGELAKLDTEQHGMQYLLFMMDVVTKSQYQKVYDILVRVKPSVYKNRKMYAALTQLKNYKLITPAEYKNLKYLWGQSYMVFNQMEYDYVLNKLEQKYPYAGEFLIHRYKEHRAHNAKKIKG